MSHPRRIPRAVRCRQKRAYHTWAEAEKAALDTIDAIQRGVADDFGKAGTLLAYRCNICGLWHVHHADPAKLQPFWHRRFVLSWAASIEGRRLL